MEPNKFWGIDFKPHLAVSTNESGKIKRLTVDYEQQALAGLPAGDKLQQSSDIYMRKVRFSGGGFGRMFLGLKILKTDNLHPAFDINLLHPVVIKELTLEGAASRVRPPIDDKGQVLPNNVTGKVHATKLSEGLREPRLMREFEAPQGPLDVLVNDKNTKLYIVQELLAGDMSKMESHLRTLQPRDRLLFLMHTLVQQLAVIHKAGCIHRDVKPLNVLVDTGGKRLLLADYGGVVETTLCASGGGSPSHRSPEQCLTGPQRYIDQKSDVFSLGVCFIDAITTKGLFSRRQRSEDTPTSTSTDREHTHFNQNDFARFQVDPEGLRADDAAAFEHFDARLKEFAEEIPQQLYDIVLGMLHVNRAHRLPVWLPDDAPERLDGVKSVEDFLVGTENMVDRDAVDAMWENVSPYSPEVVRPLRELVREVQVISEKRDHSHCETYFGATLEEDLPTMLAAINSQTPYEREMGPRIKIQWAGTLSDQIARGKLRPLAWQAWYPREAEDEPGHLLRVALMNKNERAAQLLLGVGNLGLNANGQNMNAALTALHNRFSDVARVLILQGAARDTKALTDCLGSAVTKDFDGLVPLLLEMGADPDGNNGRGRPLMYLASKRGKLPLAMFLLQHGAKVVSDTPSDRWIPAEYANHPLLSDHLRSYALVMPLIHNQPVIAQFILQKMNLDENSLALLPLLNEFAVALSSRDGVNRDALLKVFAQRYGRTLPGALSDQQRDELRSLVPVGEAAKSVQIVQRSDTRLARLQSSIVACMAPSPTLLENMSDDQRTTFGRGRAALFNGRFAEAHTLFSELPSFGDARLQSAYAAIGMKDYEKALSHLEVLGTMEGRALLEVDALNARSWTHALRGDFEKAIEDCTALLLTEVPDRVGILKRRAWCYASMAASPEVKADPKLKGECEEASLRDFCGVVNVPLSKLRIHRDSPAYMPQGGVNKEYLQLFGP